jgi:hypothetical protein
MKQEIFKDSVKFLEEGNFNPKIATERGTTSTR